jgi:acetoacetyl-CoA synthetase
LIEFTASGGAILHGRSDGVLNVRGVRVGPAEIYAILQNIEEITEALAVEQSAPDEAGGTRLILLVVLGHGFVLDQQLSARIRTELTTRGSAALVPARIAQVDELPVTYSGKRSEAAVRDVLNGRQITNVDALQNPQCLTAIANSLSLQDQSGSAGPPCADDRQADREEDLKRICEETLGVSSLRPSDDFLALGGDSLTILKLFSKIKERTRYDLPLEAFVAARTIENLAALVGIGASRGPSPQQIPRGEPHVRPMSPADIDAVCRFLEGAFPGNSISASGWKALFQAGWFPAQRQLGFLLVVGNDVVGFIATIYSHREINGRSGLICNCSSWYVVPDYRAWSVSLLAAALADAKVTYTALTPIPLAVQTLQYLGFTRLGEGKIFCAPMMHGETLRERAPLICFDAENVRRSLTDRERQIFDDHAAYDCLQVLLRDEDAYAFLVVKRRRRRIPVSEVIHCGNASLLSRHLERAKLAILRRQRTFGLIVDERLFSTPPRGIKIKDDALYRSHTFLAADLDGLYSELVLLPV